MGSADGTWVRECYDVQYQQQWYKGAKEKLRMPSWTDRIMYRSLPHFESLLKPLSYTAVNYVLLCSDHSPVIATFQLVAQNQRALNMPMWRIRIRPLAQVQVQGEDSSQAQDVDNVLALMPLPWECGSLSTLL